MFGLLRLRDYQTEAIKELHRRWEVGDTLLVRNQLTAELVLVG